MNCQYLANALVQVMDEDDVRRGLRQYETAYNQRFQQNMRAKLGLATESEADITLIMDTFSMLHEHSIDYTLFFRGLSNLSARGTGPVRDLFVDRSAFDRVVQAGGFISANCGGAPDANSIPVERDAAEASMDAASCIGCGACVAACPNASAMLFTGAKIAHMNRLPQGQPERYERALNMVLQMEAEAFGSCSNHGACENACPKGIALDVIGMLNRDYMSAVLKAG